MHKQSIMFKNGCEKINSELDIISLVNSIRRANILATVLLNEKQQALCRYQNFMLLDSNQDFNNIKKINSNFKENQWHDDIDILLKDDTFWEEQEVNQRLIEGVLIENAHSIINQQCSNSKIKEEDVDIAK